MSNFWRFSCFALLCLFLACSASQWAYSAESTVDRCKKYQRQVIREARYFLGLNAPTHYFMGQIEQESRCKEGATAFDGGMGLCQFMPATADWLHDKEPALRSMYKEPQPYNPQWAIRALILYDGWLYKQTACTGWYFAFRAYNGGAGLLNREIAAARSCDVEKVEMACRRKVLQLSGRRLLDLCEVNTEYPRLIFEKSKRYMEGR